MAIEDQDREPYEEYPLALGANGILRLSVEADYLALVDVSTDVLEVAYNGGAYRRLRLGAIIRGRGPIRSITLRNPTGGAITGTLAYGQGSYVDNRLIFATAGGGNVPVVGPEAHGAPSTTAPVQVAGEARTTERGAEVSGDVSRLVTDAAGRLVVTEQLPEQLVDGAVLAVGAGPQVLIAAGAAGVRTYLAELTLADDTAGPGASQTVILYDGATERRRVRVPAAGSVVVTFPAPLRGTDATAWNVDLGAAGTVRVSASGWHGR